MSSKGQKYVADGSDRARFPRLLICEGPEDCFFFARLIEVWGLARFHIWPSGGPGKRGGKSKFGTAVKAFQAERPNTFHSLRDIVMVADNDENPKASFDAVCQQIESVFGVGTAPKKPRERTRTIKPAVSVLMVPWDDKNGHLEKLCIDSARDADKTTGAHVDAFMASLKSASWKNESREGKAWLRANLAARCDDPFVPLGYIFDEKRYHEIIPVKHNSLKPIVDFLATFDVQSAAAR